MLKRRRGTIWGREVGGGRGGGNVVSGRGLFGGMEGERFVKERITFSGRKSENSAIS